ncbi:hypothetical protein TNCT_629511 [Trichonephila clavata]|uniref:Uncharacterized protein n=1 Tax=Trichonephila clavata TaxID=2740835 RepID=A0A8X6F9L7_TRICU|nr:hypothetical protein TNCT_629511 [Trichonephila clavata]
MVCGPSRKFETGNKGENVIQRDDWDERNDDEWMTEEHRGRDPGAHPYRTTPTVIRHPNGFYLERERERVATNLANKNSVRFPMSKNFH